MNKTLLISIGSLVIIGIAVIVFLIAGPKKQMPVNNAPPVGLPVAGSATQGSGPSAQGSSFIKTADFLSDPATIKDPINDGYYYLGYHVYEGVSDPTATTTPPYVIAYIAATQYFNIALMQEPIGQTRRDAEQYLMARLGISETQMCKLNYMVSVPDRVNTSFSGRNLGFSFCPGAIALPK